MDGHAQDVSLQAAPQRDGRAAAGRPDLSDRHARRTHHRGRRPEAQDDTFHDRPGHVAARVADGQPDECATGLRIQIGGVRSPVRYGRKTRPSAPRQTASASATSSSNCKPVTARHQSSEPPADNDTPTSE